VREDLFQVVSWRALSGCWIDDLPGLSNLHKMGENNAMYSAERLHQLPPRFGGAVIQGERG
jgi:hypothetical protein